MKNRNDFDLPLYCSLFIFGVIGNILLLSLYNFEIPTIIEITISFVILYKFGLLRSLLFSITSLTISSYLYSYPTFNHAVLISQNIFMGILMNYYGKDRVLIFYTIYWLTIGIPAIILLSKYTGLVVFNCKLIITKMAGIYIILVTFLARCILMIKDIIISKYKHVTFQIKTFDFVYTILCGLTVLMYSILYYINYPLHMNYAYMSFIVGSGCSLIISYIISKPLSEICRTISKAIETDINLEHSTEIQFPNTNIFEVTKVIDSLKFALNALGVNIHNKIASQKLMDTMFKKISKSHQIGIAIFGKKIVYANDAIEEITGFTTDELDYDIYNVIEVIIPDEYKNFMYDRIDKRLVRKETDSNSYEMKIVTKNNTIKWVSVFSTGFEYENDVMGMVTMVDITSIKEHESKLEEITKKQQKVINERIEELHKQEAVMFQQSKLASMGEMLAAISHQWRQPLNCIGIALQGIEDAYISDDLSEEFLCKIIKNSLTQLEFLSRTIDDFKSFFKPTEHKYVFSMAQAIHEIGIITSAQLKTNFIQLNVIIDGKFTPFEDLPDKFNDDILFVFGYKNELKHCLLNMITNSKDSIIAKKKNYPYLDGNITIYINSVLSGKDCAFNTITIEDNGDGVDDHIKDRLFEPYFTTKNTGTGIGLYMAKVIIEDNMNGKVYLGTKQKGQGCEMIIKVPVILKNLVF